MCRTPSTSSASICVWKASLTCAAVPVNSTNIRLGGTLSTCSPCEPSHEVITAMSAGETPYLSANSSTVSHW